MAFTGSLSGRARGCGKPRTAALLVALAGLVAACGGGGGEAGPAPSLPSGCTPIRSPEIQKATHIAAGATGSYNTTPPSSGEHYSSPARAGGYTEPIPDEVQVHNLEHGHVVVQYRDLAVDQIDQLEEVVLDDPKMILMAPYPDMDPVVAFTSWGKIQTCDVWTNGIPALLTYFILKNRDNAPESIQ